MIIKKNSKQPRYVCKIDKIIKIFLRRKIINFIIFVLYVIGLLYIVHYGISLLTARLDPVPHFALGVIIPILFGFYLAIPDFYYSIKRPGHFSINWIRLFTIGLPTLLIDSSLYLYYFTQIGNNNFAVQWALNEYNILGKTIIGMVFGYNFLASFYKSKDFNKVETNIINNIYSKRFYENKTIDTPKVMFLDGIENLKIFPYDNAAFINELHDAYVVVHAVVLNDDGEEWAFVKYVDKTHSNNYGYVPINALSEKSY